MRRKQAGRTAGVDRLLFQVRVALAENAAVYCMALAFQSAATGESPVKNRSPCLPAAWLAALSVMPGARNGSGGGK